MRFIEVPIAGAFVIDMEPICDRRGLFARTWCREEFAAHGLSVEIAQRSISFNPHKGTLRGMHYQAAPYGEVKVVRCPRGAVYDVIVDVRPRSPTYRRWFGVELSANNRRMLYIPKEVAHGILTLQPDTEVDYQMSHPRVAEAARGVRWNDPAFGVTWPAAVEVISEHDASYPDFEAT